MNDQTTATGADSTTDTNLVVLRGCVHGDPLSRTLPSGVEVLQFDLATAIAADGRTSTNSVPVAWTDPGTGGTALVTNGVELVVIGSVRRRFFRVAGATRSRTEVVADSVIPTRRRKRVAAALGRAAARLAIA